MQPSSHHNMVWWFIVRFKSWSGGKKHQIMHNTFFYNQFIANLWPGYCHIVIHPCTCWASGQNIIISFDESNICEICTIKFASAMNPPSINAYKLLSPDHFGNLHKPLTLWVKRKWKVCVCLFVRAGHNKANPIWDNLMHILCWLNWHLLYNVTVQDLIQQQTTLYSNLIGNSLLSTSTTTQFHSRPRKVKVETSGKCLIKFIKVV